MRRRVRIKNLSSLKFAVHDAVNAAVAHSEYGPAMAEICLSATGRMLSWQACLIGSYKPGNGFLAGNTVRIEFEEVPVRASCGGNYGTEIARYVATVVDGLTNQLVTGVGSPAHLRDA